MSTSSVPGPVLLPPTLGPAHQRRLRAVWRSAGWPFQDLIEIDLLAAGLLLRKRDGAGRDTVCVSDTGIRLLAQTLARNRAARCAHEDLVARVAREMARAGRVVWRGLSLRARVGVDGEVAGGVADVGGGSGGGNGGRNGGRNGGVNGGTTGQAVGAVAVGGSAAAAEPGWAIAMPDVYSIRHTTVEAYVEPVAHEIKVHRSDLLADLRRPAKGEAYRWLSSQCWYVIRAGIAQPQEIPEVYGVLLAQPGGALEVARPAPSRAMRLPFAVWMALARATPEALDDDAQVALMPLDPLEPLEPL